MSITIRDAIKRLDKKQEVEVDLVELSWVVGLEEVDFCSNEHLKAYYLVSNVCMGRKIGISFYFLYDKCVCYREHTSSRGKLCFVWLNSNCKRLVHDYLWDISIKQIGDIQELTLDTLVKDMYYFSQHPYNENKFNIRDI